MDFYDTCYFNTIVNDNYDTLDNNCYLERQILYRIDKDGKLLPYQMYFIIHYILKQLIMLLIIGIYIICAWTILYFRILRRFKIFKDIFG